MPVELPYDVAYLADRGGRPKGVVMISTMTPPSYYAARELVRVLIDTPGAPTREGELIELEEVGGNEGATEATETARTAPPPPGEVPPPQQEEVSARFGTAGA